MKRILCILREIFPGLNGWLVLGTWALVVVTILALSDSNAALKRSQRAWLAPLGTTLDVPLKVGGPIKVAVSYGNTGKEPALDVHEYAQLFVTGAADAEARGKKLEPLYSQCLKFAPADGAITVFPSQSSPYAHHYIMDNAIDDGLLKGEKIIILAGCLVYRTVDETHRSIYCNYYQNGSSPEPNAFAACLRGNFAD